jgi:2-haloacid dehalogenase
MSPIPQQETSCFRAVAFDLLTALMNSWSLWIEVAGEDALGRAWRRNSLHRVTTAGAYRPYETIVYEAAHEVGLSASRSDHLLVMR